MRSFMDRAAMGCLVVLGVVSFLHGPGALSGLVPKAETLLIGGIVFLSCVCGMIIAHVRTRNELAGAGGAPRDDLSGSVEAAVAARTRWLSAKISEIEKARAAAVEANMAKSRFLATMSHELRTPLNAILGFSEIIEREMYGKAGDQRYPEYARHIHDSGAHLLSLIRDILDLSKIEAGKMEIACEAISVGELIDEVRQLSNVERNHMLSVVIDNRLPTVMADRRAAKQMLLNLLSNAMKFTAPGRTIAIRAQRRADGRVTLAVIDNGIGIAAADIPKALAAYAQVPNDETRRHDGTGLGLPIVNALMKLHGGSLELTSEVGVGTTVSLHFPAAVPVAAAA